LLLSLTLLSGLVLVGAGGPTSSATAATPHALGAGLDARGMHEVGRDVTVGGVVFELAGSGANAAPAAHVPATFSLQVRTPAGEIRGPYGPYTARPDGTFAVKLPGEATQGIHAAEDAGFQAVAAVEVVNASYNDPATGAWTADRAGVAALRVHKTPHAVRVENSFVSAVGWVKPGESYPSRLIVRNYKKKVVRRARVTVPRVSGTHFTKVNPTKRSGRARVRRGTIVWKIGRIPAARKGVPAMKTLLVTARAKKTKQDPRVVWKNLSSTARLRYRGHRKAVKSKSHGPKVIPPDQTFDTARYGDRPFPVVPVDYFDRKHDTSHSGQVLAKVINSPKKKGSTFNLYQEMSYKQLFPHGTVPSAGIATADFNVKWKSKRFKNNGFNFTTPQPQGSCHGATQPKQTIGTPLYNERIHDGWYQLPGDTDYYGDDRYGSAIIGSVAGVGSLQSIDDACGPTGKAVYDAAQIADPEIDYSDYDTNKDGVVDFFMMIFTGVGGHGVSQTSVPPYDNIWPHSSTLESYTDPKTGLKGYISDDQLKDLEGKKLYYTNKSRSQMTRKKTKFPVYVRVGPYNVNPEDAVDHASVISHEYGHSLGLPDFYSTGSRETYGDWNLMATDKSQNMDVFSKQELGWLVPRVLHKGKHRIRHWHDSKRNTHRIDWKTRSGKKYRLKGKSVNNGEGYVAPLPRRQIIDPAKVRKSASADHVWWSESGNNFGCPPDSGHNLDVYLPELAKVKAGTPITVTFKSNWQIEWDYDYGFVMYSTDDGASYTSMPSQKNYTTPAVQNPNSSGCQTQYGNGLTGSTGSYQANTAQVDRVQGNYPDGPFVKDSYDMSAAAGSSTVLRFAYSTDPGLAKRGWFIDNLKVKAGKKVIYKSKFEGRDTRLYNGGCSDDLTTAQKCTHGWSYLSATAGSPADHAYYMEMRDRSGFDKDGRGENDRAPIGFLPGLLLVYTDEAHGYGNAGTDDPPAQTPLDSQPEPGNQTPNLNDAAWTAAASDNKFSDFGAGHTDNYLDPTPSGDKEGGNAGDGNWHFQFGCLSFKVLKMKGEDIANRKNLTGNVAFKLGAGCGKFNYGY
jgi:immune inhibitor A